MRKQRAFDKTDAFLLAYFGVPAIIVVCLFTALYFRVSGDIQVCRSYYPEMSTAQCYFSSKTVRVPNGR